MITVSTFFNTFGANANAFIIIKVIIVVLVNWSCRFSSIMLIVECIMVVVFYAHIPNFFWTRVFLVFVLATIPDHTPLKYRCPIEMIKWFGHVFSPIAFIVYIAIYPPQGGHSLLYWCIHVRSRPIYWGAIYLAENIIRYGVFQNKGKCLYFNTPYQNL